MKALLATAATIGLLAATPAFAQAGAPSSATANADAVIVAPISIVKVTDLNFGRIAADSAASTVTVNAAGARTSSSPSVLIAAGSTPTAATFTITGEPGLSYSHSHPSTVTLTGPAGSTAMTATFLPEMSSGGTLDTTGSAAYALGASLAVGASQMAGAYTGSFSVSVQYN